MSVILVGNGPSILKAPIGDKVDAFDVVVRINQFSTEQAKYTGKKLTTWFTDRWFDGDFVDWSQHPSILCKTGLNIEDLDRLESFGKLKRGKIKAVIRLLYFAQQNGYSYDEYPREFKTMIRNKVGRLHVKPGRSCPSAGLSLVWYYLDYLHCPQVTIYGFDHFRGNKHHYFDN